MRLTDFKLLTFDCYGTLIDWETGILEYLQRLLRSKGKEASDAEILNLYSELEPVEQSRAYRSYREVLAGVVHGFAREFEFDLSTGEANGLAASIANWKPFPDTVHGLRRLKSRYRLAILSNIDDDLFAFTAKRLQVTFDLIVTAQQVRSYKPSHRNFETLLEQTGASRGALLHTAESLYHDVIPAHELGIATVWVNRRQGKAAAATKAVEARPDFEVANVEELAELVLPRATGSLES
jgi:2-haloacid dehalogenase